MESQINIVFDRVYKNSYGLIVQNDLLTNNIAIDENDDDEINWMCILKLQLPSVIFWSILQ